MNGIKISIIIPVYNVEKYLEQCVKSILYQSYENKEIILVDDGSTDNSPKLCDELASENKCVNVIHKKNGGLSDARNKGIEKASGDYILFVDSDDFIEENSLKYIADIVNENPADVVFLEAQKYFENGTQIPLGDGITKESVYKKSKDEVLSFISQCPKYPASACSKLIKSELFDNSEVLFEKGLLSEDLDWTLKLLLKAETFDYCNKMYYNYRQNRVGSITNIADIKKIQDMIYILEKWAKIAQEKPINEKNFILSQMAYELPIIIYLYGQLKKEYRSQFKNRINNLLFLLKYRTELKYKCVKLILKLFDIEITSLLINILYRYRVR